MKCPGCGADIGPRDAFCGACGYKISDADTGNNAAAPDSADIEIIDINDTIDISEDASYGAAAQNGYDGNRNGGYGANSYSPGYNNGGSYTPNGGQASGQYNQGGYNSSCINGGSDGPYVAQPGSAGKRVSNQPLIIAGAVVGGIILVLIVLAMIGGSAPVTADAGSMLSLLKNDPVAARETYRGKNVIIENAVVIKMENNMFLAHTDEILADLLTLGLEKSPHFARLDCYCTPDVYAGLECCDRVTLHGKVKNIRKEKIGNVYISAYEIAVDSVSEVNYDFKNDMQDLMDSLDELNRYM